MADWGDAFSEAGKDLKSAGEAVHNWWDAFEPEVEHKAKLIGNNVGRGVAGAAGLAADALPVAKLLFNPGSGATPANLEAVRNTNPVALLQGKGRISQKVAKLYNDTAGVVPIESNSDKYVAAGAQGIGSAVLGGEGGVLPVVAAGVGGGVGSQAAADLFPNSDLAPVVGGIIGGGAGYHAGGIPERVSAARTVVRGASHPDYPYLVDTVKSLEGGGTLDNPKVNPKSGATGPMQVTMDTARKPGYGIRPWDGKSQADLARVGRQKLAAMLGKYNDPEKALAAYNWGEGHLDAAIKKYGDNWYDHAPHETKEYVANGMSKTYGGPRSVSPEGDGVPPMDPAELSSAMGDPEAGIQAETGDNVIDFPQREESPVPEDVLTPSERQDMDASVDKPVVDNTGYERFTPNPEEKLPANDDNVHSLADARQTQDLKDFHADLMSKVSDRAELQRQLTQEAKDQGLFSYDVGDRFTTTKSRENGDGPWKVVGHYVDPKDPERYGYYVERGSKEANDYERSQMLISDPKADARRIEKGWGPYDRAADVQSWQKLGDVKEAPKSELVRDQNPPAKSNAAGTARPEGVNRTPPVKSEETHDNPEVAPEDVGPVARLRQAIEEARPLRGEQDRATSRERAKRFQAASEVGKYTSGEEGFYAELSKLKGSMPKKEFESLRDNLHQSEIDELTDIIKNHPRISYAESTSARRGLLRIIDGEVPNKSQLKLLGEIFPKDLLDTVSSKKPDSTTLGSMAADVLNTPRALMASVDVSAPGRQGIFLIGTGPFWSNIPKMFKGLISEDNYKAMNDAIAARPTYPLMKRAGLALTNTGRTLADREEQFMSNLAEKIPGIGKIVRASDRAYSGYLNGLRADTFDNLLKLSKEAGIDFKENPKGLRDIARYVNAATGRGDLGKLNQAAPLLSGLFFSPRLMASRVSLLNPAFYIRLSPVVRQYAIKNLLSFAAIATLTLGLAKLGGANVDTDPRSTDFAKIRIKNTRLDILGGFQSYIRAFSQLISGQTVNPDSREVTDLTKNKYGGRTRRDVVMTFFENKFSPVAGLVDTLLSMTHDKSGDLVDKYGNKTSVPKSVAMDFVPMIVSDTYQATQDLGTKGLLTVAPNAFGVGVQSYQPKPHKDRGSKKKDPFDFSMDFGSEKKGRHKKDEWGF